MSECVLEKVGGVNKNINKWRTNPNNIKLKKKLLFECNFVNLNCQHFTDASVKQSVGAEAGLK